MRLASKTFLLTLLGTASNAFCPSRTTQLGVSALHTSSLLRHVVEGDADGSSVLDKVQRLLWDAPPVDEQFDSNLKSLFPGAMSNNDFELRVVEVLHGRGLTAANTLLTTCLCSDELATRLADDFAKVYGNNYNLGGLAGFPFAGNIGFETMSGHIPDDGFCLLVYGPHVGVTADGVVGKVERDGVALVDDCCRSAVESYNYLKERKSSDAAESTNGGMQAFTDLQQNAVQNLMQPLVSTRLESSEHPLWDLPYALFESQDNLIREIVHAGLSGTKRGLVMLGGIQINTGPGTPDYFVPLHFEYMNNRGEIVEDMLPTLA